MKESISRAFSYLLSAKNAFGVGVAEMALAHVIPDKVEAAYFRGMSRPLLKLGGGSVDGLCDPATSPNSLDPVIGHDPLRVQ